MKVLSEITLEGDYLDEAVTLHMRALPDDFLTLLGEKALRIYYTELHQLFYLVYTFRIEDELDFGYVHFGFGQKKSLFLYFIRKLPLRLLLFSIIHPLYAIELFMYSNHNKFLSNELLYIYVNRHGKRFGSDLLDFSFSKLPKNELFVKTLSETPENIKFYEKNGFKIFDKMLGRTILRKDL